MRYRIRSALFAITAGVLLGSGPALAESLACKADLTGDGVVNFRDLAVMKAVFFETCNDPGPRCGDGIVQAPEQCDDHNLLNGDGCSNACKIEVPPPVMCGDGIAQGPTETCDDGNVLNGDGCSATCTIEPPITIGGSAVIATGQTTCWNTDGVEIPCGGTGHDGEIQAGETLAYVDHGDGTITDTNTGLVWEKLSDDGTIHDWNNRYTWDDAFAVKVATLNGGGGFAGHGDWRVPNRRELDSIVNLEILYPGPTVDQAFNTGCTSGCTVTTCSCTQSRYYWSSSSYAFSPSSAWGVYFGSGSVSAIDEREFTYVRAVRGGL